MDAQATFEGIYLLLIGPTFWSGLDAISCQLAIIIENLVKWVTSNGLALNLKKRNI